MSFYGIRKEYQLSVKTIKYLQKNFNYMCKGMANKAAASGLTLEHFKLAYSRNGVDGIQSLMSELTPGGKPQVTKNKSVIAKLASFFTHH